MIYLMKLVILNNIAFSDWQISSGNQETVDLDLGKSSKITFIQATNEWHVVKTVLYISVRDLRVAEGSFYLAKYTDIHYESTSTKVFY